MFSIFKKLFRRKSKVYSFFKHNLAQFSNEIYNNETKVFYVDSFIYNINDLQKIRMLIKDNVPLWNIVKDLKKDLLVDIIKLYIIQTNGKHYIAFVLDPIELLKNEKILEIMPINEESINIDQLEKIDLNI